MKPRIYVLDSRAGEVHLRGFRRNAELLEKEIEIRIERKRYEPQLPKDHDAYLIHLSDTEEENVHSLREAQPWSKIYCILRGDYDRRQRLQGIIDTSFFILHREDYQHIIKEAWKLYEKSQAPRN